MSDLDKKLDKILNGVEWRDGERKINQLEALASIKRAFIDAGWIPEDVAKKSIRVERCIYSHYKTKKEK